MKIKRRHLKRLIERYLAEEDKKEEETLDKNTGLNDYIAALKSEEGDDDEEKKYEIPEKTKDSLRKFADASTDNKITNDKTKYTEDTFGKEYGQLATTVYHKGEAWQ